jgi:dihydroneopterin aldolase
MAIKSIFRLLRGETPSQSNMRIFVRGLRIDAFIGVHPHEYERRQPIIVDVELDMGDMPAPKEDRLHETLDYGVVAQKVAAIALDSHVQLVETLGDRVACWALSSDKRVQACAVRISKPQALDTADLAGVEVIRRRDD